MVDNRKPDQEIIVVNLGTLLRLSRLLECKISLGYVCSLYITPVNKKGLRSHEMTLVPIMLPNIPVSPEFDTCVIHYLDKYI